MMLDAPLKEGEEVGKRRDWIVLNHLLWLEAGGMAQHEKDFSAAPIAAFVAAHPVRRKPGHRRGWLGRRR